MCIVVAGNECAGSKDVFEKRLGRDVKQAVRRLGMTPTSISVTTRTIMMTSPNKVWGLLVVRAACARPSGLGFMVLRPRSVGGLEEDEQLTALGDIATRDQYMPAAAHPCVTWAVVGPYSS
jgi:hypothetical protein